MEDWGHFLCVLETMLLTTPGGLTHTSQPPSGKVQPVPSWLQTRAQMLESLSFPVHNVGCIEVK